MEHNEARRAWAELALTPYIGAESFLLLLKKFGSAEAALAAPVEEVATCVHMKQALQAWQGGKAKAQAQQAADHALNWAEQSGCRLMMLCDDDFPPLLSEGITPPPLLFLRGNATFLNQPSVAIVGSRHATPQAMRIARDFGEALGQQGIPVVSGMAAGIDTAAHQGALQAKAATIAVWGTGIDRIYPQSNRELAYQIAESGVIVSEFPLGTRPLAGNFPRRNRLIAALSRATLVVEAALESGSLITARLAAEMGREVMAVPGSIDNPHSKGCHKLIKEGAKLAECLDDILQECSQLLQKSPLLSYSINKEENSSAEAVKSQSKNKERVNQAPAVVKNVERPSEKSENSLLTVMGYDPIHPDSLTEQTGLTAVELYEQLLELELNGAVASMPGGRYQRIK